jgi:pheromone shutdown protein TraB
VLLEVLLAWFLINSICSAIGAAIALGHPVTILAAFVAAPFTSLNPTIGAGWVAGYVEVKVNAPTVEDIRKLSKVETFRDFFGNRLIRLLMVMALANLGSMIGTFIAGYYIGDLVLF